MAIRSPVSTRRATSLVGLLITMACILVLSVILMTSLNKAVTGEGSAVQNTVHSFQDELYLKSLFSSMSVAALDMRGSYLTPSELTGTADRRLDTTANLYSAMVMANYSPPKQLISANEFSNYVWEMEDYDYTVYQPRDRVYWDPAFKADLQTRSHVSFSHMPLFGRRFDTHWRSSMDSMTPLLGNRGPKDGIDNPASRTYGRSGKWGGHVLFGDGHIQFTESFFITTPGSSQPDNLFLFDDGSKGADAVLGFTKTMTSTGPEMQWD